MYLLIARAQDKIFLPHVSSPKLSVRHHRHQKFTGPRAPKVRGGLKVVSTGENFGYTSSTFSSSGLSACATRMNRVGWLAARRLGNEDMSRGDEGGASRRVDEPG